MANRRDIELGVGVRGFPDDWTKEQMDDFLRRLSQTREDTSGPPLIVTFEEAQEILSPQPASPAPQPAPTNVDPLYRAPGPEAPPTPGPEAPPTPELTYEEQREAERAALEEDAASVRQIDQGNRLGAAWEEASGYAKEILDAVIRGAATPAAGAVVGTALTGGNPLGGFAGAAATTGADLVTSILNRTLGTDWTMPSEAVKDFLQRKMGVEPPETLVGQVTELASNAAATSLVGTGLAGSYGNAPSAGTQINTPNQPMITRGPTGGPVSPSSWNATAAQAANAPVQNALSAVPGTFAQEGASRMIQERGIAPEWANLLASPFGVGADLAFNMGADRLTSRAAARQAPIPENVQRQIDITQRMDPSDPLTTDEMLMLNRPTMAEGAGTAARLGSKESGVSDTFQRRFQTQQDRTVNWMEEQGVELTEYGNVRQLQREHLGEILRSYGEQRGIYLDEFSSVRDNVIEGLSDPRYPVPVPNTRSAIEGIVEELDAQNPTRFADTNRKLEMTLANLEQGLPLDKAYEELRNIRAEIQDPNLPQGAQRQVDNALTDAANALRSDIDRYIVNNAGESSLEALDAANKGLAGLVEDFKDQSTEDLINQLARQQGRETVESVHSFIRPDAPMNEAEAFYNNLNPKGQRMLQQSVYGEILRRSIPEGQMLPSPKLINSNTAQFEQWLDIFRKNTKDITEDVGKFGIIVDKTSAYDPQPLDDLNQINEFTREVVGLAEEMSAGAPQTVRRLSLGESPTAGIVLSQAIRRLGMGAGLFIGDIMTGSFGTIARRFQRPEVRDMHASLRAMTPGTERYLEGVKRLLRELYVSEISGRDDASEERTAPVEAGRRPGYSAPTNPRVAPTGTR